MHAWAHGESRELNAKFVSFCTSYTHLLKKPFTCDLCSRGFCQARSLENHKRNNHKIGDDLHPIRELKRLTPLDSASDQNTWSHPPDINVSPHSTYLKPQFFREKCNLILCYLNTFFEQVGRNLSIELNLDVGFFLNSLLNLTSNNWLGIRVW